MFCFFKPFSNLLLNLPLTLCRPNWKVSRIPSFPPPALKDILFLYKYSINPFRMKTPIYLFPRGNKPLLYHQIGNRNFFIFITKPDFFFFFCVDKIKYSHLTILSNLNSCQFAPRIVIFNPCICCQFEDSQIIWPKIIPMGHRSI